MTNNVFKTGDVESRPSSKLKPVGKIYWSRFLVAIAAAIVCATTGLTDLIGVALGISFYVFSYALARYLLRIGPREIGGMRPLYFKGIGTYFFTWITTWTILYTLMHQTL